MRNEISPQTQDDQAIDGQKYYCHIEEITKTAEDGWPDDEIGEVHGTKVNIMSVDEDNLLLGSFIKRGYIKTEWGYRRQIRKAVKGSLDYIIQQPI